MMHRLVTASLSVLAGLALAAAPVAATAADPPAEQPAPNAAGIPAPDAPDAQWYAWSEAVRADAEATDWAADARARGCTLISVSVTHVAMPEANEAAGAPSDMLTPLVDRVEDCAPAASLSRSGDAGSLTTSAALGSSCRTTTGPGTACISRSGSYVVTSFTYRGSGTISGFLRIYRIPTGSSGCPTGTTLRTGPVQSYTYGTQRSVSVTALQYGHYSGHFWRYVGSGYTDWGAACAML